MQVAIIPGVTIFVSIPHRYAENGRITLNALSWSSVSIPHRYAENQAKNEDIFSLQPVSIPHRYAENGECAGLNSPHAPLFQFLIGTLKTEELKGKRVAS